MPQVGLSVPAPDLNWELVVLDGTRARVVGNGPAVRLRRGDRILAVQEAGRPGSMVVGWEPFFWHFCFIVV